jgi:hypothetical protein
MTPRNKRWLCFYFWTIALLFFLFMIDFISTVLKAFINLIAQALIFCRGFFLRFHLWVPSSETTWIFWWILGVRIQIWAKLNLNSNQYLILSKIWIWSKLNLNQHMRSIAMCYVFDRTFQVQCFEVTHSEWQICYKHARKLGL